MRTSIQSWAIRFILFAAVVVATVIAPIQPAQAFVSEFTAGYDCWGNRVTPKQAEELAVRLVMGGEWTVVGRNRAIRTGPKGEVIDECVGAVYGGLWPAYSSGVNERRCSEMYSGRTVRFVFAKDGTGTIAYGLLNPVFVSPRSGSPIM